MRHLLNPLDFSVEEIDDLLALQGTLNRIFQDTPMYATARSWPTLFYEPSYTDAFKL